MISYRLRLLVFLSSILIVLHGIEEYLTNFHHIDPIFLFVFAPLLKGNANQAAFVTFQIMAWMLLFSSFVLLQGRKWILRMLCILGIVMIFELHHFVEAMMTQSYYSGLLTASLFPVLAFFYWKELLKEFRRP